MAYQHLSSSLTEDILRFLDVAPGPAQANLRYLNRLIPAYLRRVPWESVSRIIKRRATARTEDCPRWPDEFWREAIQCGFGGTCFESSLAFYSLLRDLGYEGYLTVNDMGDSRGCHAAIVVLLHGQKYLVDVTIPVHAAVRIDPARRTRRNTAFLNYTIRPVAEDKYHVTRSHKPHGYVFTLIDVPVSLADYQSIMINDYLEPTGRFLKGVVIVKFMVGRTWRFFSDHQPYRLESFNRAGKREISVRPEVLAYLLAGVFQMPEDKISAALAAVSNRP